jgi:hypothetical protein
LFLAGPGTYAPYDRRRPSRYPYGFSGYVPTVYSPTVVETVVVEREVIIEREVPRPEAAPSRAAAPDREPVVVYVTPAKPKTLYVIPRCYAGDRRPSADQLPAGCELSALRVIPPAE